MKPIRIDTGADQVELFMEPVRGVVRDGGAGFSSANAAGVERVAAAELGRVITALARGLAIELPEQGAGEVSVAFALSVDEHGRAVLGTEGALRVSMKWSRPASE
jgi:hypothetical protein